ncbi:MAG: tetratricopeptide repeat protein [Polyangiaceae bacterium]|nr:tetratricopeptide repeat protein [Polyangiaceae bacterium]
MKTLRLSVGAKVLIACALAGGMALSAAPQGVADLYRKSYRAEAQNRPIEALEAMKTILSRDKDSYFVNVRTGWVAYLAGRFAESEQAYRRAAKAQPKAIEAKLGLTLPLMAGKKWTELEAASRAVLALDPKNNAARARLGLALYSRGNYPDAATTYRGLMADYPGELDHQTGLGWALAKMGRMKEARGVFEAVLAVSPDNPNARASLKKK